MAPKDETPWRPCASDAAGPAVPQREPAAGAAESLKISDSAQRDQD